MKPISTLVILALLALSLLCMIKKWRVPSVVLLVIAMVLYCYKNWEGVYWIFVDLFR